MEWCCKGWREKKLDATNSIKILHFTVDFDDDEVDIYRICLDFYVIYKIFAS